MRASTSLENSPVRGDRTGRGRTPIWRAILWVERFLPKPVENRWDNSKEARHRGFTCIVLASVVLPIIVRERGVFAEIWPRWHGMIEQFVLLVAIVMAVAVILAWVVTWRRERKNHA